jgi:hypothetical protein
MDERGWHESLEAGPRFVSHLFASGCYQKSGFSLAFTARPTPRTSGMVTVTLQNMGNLDTRTLPRLSDATLLRGYRISSTYVTTATVSEVGDVTRKLFEDRGWNDHFIVDSRRDDYHEYEIFRLTKGQICLTVRVSRSLIRRGRTLVQYSQSMVSADAAAPAEPRPFPPGAYAMRSTGTGPMGRP